MSKERLDIFLMLVMSMEWLDKSITLLQDDVLLEEFKNNAQNEARKFDLNQIVGRYIAVYQEALENQ